MSDATEKRVIVIFGLDHKYYLEENLQRAGQEIQAARDFFSETEARHFSIPPSIKDKSIRNIIGAKRLLESRLAPGFYGEGLRGKLSLKLKQFDAWVEALS